MSASMFVSQDSYATEVAEFLADRKGSIPARIVGGMHVVLSTGYSMTSVFFRLTVKPNRVASFIK